MWWQLYLMLQLAVAWDIYRHQTIIKEASNLTCPNGSVVGCTCASQECVAIGPWPNGCYFTPFPDSSPIRIEIACGNIPNVTTYFATSPSNSTAKSIGCGNDFVTDCLWSGQNATDVNDGILFNQSSKECMLQTTALGVTPIAICMNRTTAWNVKLSSAYSGCESCLQNEKLLGCQCSKGRGADCEAIVLNGSCSSNTQLVVGFCLEERALERGCSMTVPSYLEFTNCQYRLELPHQESCELQCRDGKRYLEQFAGVPSVTCLNGTLSALPNLGCPQGAEVQFEVEFESISCGVDLANETVRLVIIDALLSVARADLGFPPDLPEVLSASSNSSGIKCAVWFDNPRNASSFSRWASLDNMTRSFNLTSIFDVPCEVVVLLRNVTLLFESLFTFLSDLAPWVLILCVSLLVVAIIVFLFVNRASAHPFAVLGAIVSIINVASKAVFINFLFNTSDALSVAGLPSKFFVDASTAAVCVLALAFLFNFVVTVRLFTVHYEKNSHEFGPWWAKHRAGVAVVLLLCGLNPASFLILCSSTFDADLCKGPVSLQAQKRFQVMGLVSVLLVDIPFVCIQILTYTEVVSSSVLSWSGGASSVILGLCFSLVSIALGIMRRTCAVCLAKHPKAKLTQAEMTSS